MNLKDYPILEQFDDEPTSLDMFFSNGKKEFWKFDKVKKLGIDKCVIFLPRDFRKLTDIYSKCKLIYQFKAASSISPVYLYDNKILIALCPLGGPASANLMEELTYVGIRQFIGVGSCGAVSDVNIDDYFVPDRAIRDEGTSYHYLAPSRYVETSKNLADKIIKVLSKNNEAFTVGTVWTTDAMYRETPKKVEQRLRDGAIAVEMETASLCAVAQAKKAEYACLLYYSDHNTGTQWKSRMYDKFQIRREVINYAVEALLNY